MHLVHELGLRPLAVHFDNGWNSNTAVSNIKKLCTKLDVDLFTYVVEWEEFKNIQISFLKASVPCIEAPTDVGIHGVLMRMASKYGAKYILGGQSFKTEGTVPKPWSYIDGTYIKTIQNKFGSVPIKSFPNLSLFQVAWFTFIRGVKQIPFLNYYDYDKKVAKIFLKENYEWEDYSGHHYENIYSKFSFGWYLPKKFNIDKRKVSLSGPVRSSLMSRAEALELLKIAPQLGDEEDLIQYTHNKLDLTRKEFDEIMSLPPKWYSDYFTSDNIIRYLKWPIKLATKMGFLTPVLYEKFLGGSEKK